MKRLVVVGVAAVLAAGSVAQMEKREDGLYERAAFAAAKPAIGDVAPGLDLLLIDGRPWSLEALRGRTVVLIKGGFT